MAGEGDHSDQKKSIINPSFLKGLLAGVVISHINKALILGAMIGVASGIYLEQNNPKDLPDVKQKVAEIYQKFRGDES